MVNRFEQVNWKDRRNKAPANITSSELGFEVSMRLPMSTMTHRDSYCLLVYIDMLEKALIDISACDSKEGKRAKLALKYLTNK